MQASGHASAETPRGHPEEVSHLARGKVVKQVIVVDSSDEEREDTENGEWRLF
jgi:hypothetical protein